jgi:hypothetical protein
VTARREEPSLAILDTLVSLVRELDARATLQDQFLLSTVDALKEIVERLDLLEEYVGLRLNELQHRS